MAALLILFQILSNTPKLFEQFFWHFRPVTFKMRLDRVQFRGPFIRVNRRNGLQVFFWNVRP